MSTKYFCVVAIDFGTTYSGYAFSTRSEFEMDPLRVASSTWTGSRLMSLKTPSCILFRPDREFHSFGFDAEDKYADLTYDNEHKQWYFFRRFKMSLYNSKDVHRTTEIRDETGKPMPAMKVFSTAIRYLKDHAIDVINSRMKLNEADIKWVLTVPAIWDDAAKQFMREAAVQSGLPDRQLVLSLEPEAASMFCKYLPVEMLMNSKWEISCFKTGSKYLVLDAGGGTVDITVHEVLETGKLRELHKVNGGAWGGTTVDKAYIDFIDELTADLPLSDYMEQNKDDFMEMMREFEVKKRSATPDMDSKTTFKMPISLFEWYRQNDKQQRELREAIKENPSLSGKVVLAGDKMRADCEVVKSFFNKTCDQIVSHIKKIFNEPMAKDITAILMVGGFSESAMLQGAVRQAFPEKRIIIPNEAGLAVLKGAVLFGHDSSVITARIAKYTYGLKVRSTYNRKIHPQERLDQTGKRVQGVFSKLVEVGQPTSVNDRQQKHNYQPLDGHTSFELKLYASPEKDPKYVDDPGCFKVGQVTVDCRNRDGSIGGASVWLVFGGTELEVFAENDKGFKTTATFDFLE